MEEALTRYGQTFLNETPELLSSKLKELDEALERESDDDKKWYSVALDRAPGECDDKFKLKHLRCEVFRVQDTVKRMLKYWDKRVEIFGEEKAFLPMTLDGALKDDITSLRIAYIQSTHLKDDGGRIIMFLDPGRLPKDGSYDRLSMTRAFWYSLHSVLEDEEVQKKGCVIIGHPKNAPHPPDFKMMRMKIGSLQGCIPIRVGAIHICHPPVFFKVVWPVIRMIMNKVMKKRVHVHSGKDEEVMKKLKEKYAIEKHMIPTDMSGGELVLDEAKWLEERRGAGK